MPSGRPWLRPEPRVCFINDRSEGSFRYAARCSAIRGAPVGAEHAKRIRNRGVERLYADKNDAVAEERDSRISVVVDHIQIDERRAGLAEVEYVHLSVKVENCIVTV